MAVKKPCVKATCARCGGNKVLFGAWASWSERDQSYVLERLTAREVCEDCSGEADTNENTTVDWWLKRENSKS
ncbi:MAG: hypothetical protein MJE66_01755 [Proteobacteria bacterium]|nr:hypothetical protein [Pseudomonadota bacterium]